MPPEYAFSQAHEIFEENKEGVADAVSDAVEAVEHIPQEGGEVAQAAADAASTMEENVEAFEEANHEALEPDVTANDLFEEIEVRRPSTHCTPP